MSCCIYDRMEQCSHDCETCSNCIREECVECGEWFPWSDMEKEGNNYYCSECYERLCEEASEEESA